ncbi:MAG: replication initiation protein [bacterium]|nr:replication initiation protein [bacterium]
MQSDITSKSPKSKSGIQTKIDAGIHAIYELKQIAEKAQLTINFESETLRAAARQQDVEQAKINKLANAAVTISKRLQQVRQQEKLAGFETAIAKNNVNMANALVFEAQMLSLVEKRVLFLGISKLYPTTDAEPLVTISADEYAALFNIDKAEAYRQLKIGVNGLFDAQIQIETKRRRWIDETDSNYEPGSGMVAMRFTKFTTPMLRNMREKGGFTRYQIGAAGTLKKVGSWRLMEVCAMNNSFGKFRLTLEQLHSVLDASTSDMNSFKQFNQRTINAAVKELNKPEGLNLGLEYETERNSKREVVAIRFVFRKHQFGAKKITKEILKPAQKLTKLCEEF